MAYYFDVFSVPTQEACQVGDLFAHKDGHGGCTQMRACTEDGLLHECDVDLGNAATCPLQSCIINTYIGLCSLHLVVLCLVVQLEDKVFFFFQRASPD